MSDPDSARVMAAIDSLSPKFRALVHEFGAVIVTRMIADGYDNAEQLRDVLTTWRDRRQSEWLATDYITPRTTKGFADAVIGRNTHA